MKIKRKALSVLSCLALIASSLPSTAVFVSADESNLTKATDEPIYVTISGKDGKTEKAVFANGNDITVELSTDGKTNVVKYVDSEGTNAKLTNVPFDADVFAGCHGDATSVGTAEKPVKITIDGAHLKTVYGGGLHESTVENVEITVKGEAELQWVCGGGANALIHDDCEEGAAGKAWVNGIDDVKNSPTQVKNATINFEAGNVTEAVYGGGQGLSNTANTTVNIKDGTIKYVCAGGSNGKTEEAQVNITGGTITDVASANRGTMERSDITVNGGTVTNLYIGATDTADVKTSDVTVASGKVTNMKPGKSKGTELTKDEFTGDDNYSFSVSPEATVSNYDETLNPIKDTQNDYYYFKAYKKNDEVDNTKDTSAGKLTCITQVMQSSKDQKMYHCGFVMANGQTVTATDVKDESGKWKATKIACTGEGSDGSYVETNYDLVHLFGGSHNSDEKVESTDVTLDGTTHVQTVWGGGWHKSQTGTTKVTVKGNAEVKGIQGGAAAFFAGTNCGISGCSGYNGQNSSKPCIEKPEQDTPEAYNVEGNARVEKAEVIVESCKPYTTPSGVTEVTRIFGGGECYAYTGTANVTVSGGDFGTEGIVYPAGSNGYTGESTLVVDGNVTIPKVASAKSGIVKSANIEIKNGTVEELTLGMIESTEGYGKIEASEVTVSGGTVKDVKMGHRDVENPIKPESDEGYTLNANGGTIEKVGGEDVDYSKQDFVCDHASYIKETEPAGGQDATCGADGKYNYWQCSNCKHYFADVNADKHYDAETDKDVTKEDGSLNEEDTIDNNGIKIEASNEHHVFETVEPKVNITCKDQNDKGMEAHATCTICGQLCKATLKEGKEDETSRTPDDYDFTEVDGYGDLYITAPEHTPKTVDAVEATCTEEGHSEYSVCEECGTILTVMTITPKIPHTQGEVVKGTPASCTKTGLTDGYKCTVCEQTYGQEVIPVDDTKHTFTEYTYNNDATCEADGTETAVCDECKVAKDTRAKAETALGHEYVAVEAKAATCTEDGIKEGYYQCSRCDKYFTAETTGEGEEAQTVYTEVNAEEVIEPAKGHTSKTVEGVAATCTKTGLTEGEVCEVCGTVLKAQEEIPMIDHTVEKIPEVKATCEIWGLTEGTKCSVCGNILVAQTLLPPLGHDYDENGVCTRDGARDPNYVDTSSVDNGNSKPGNSSNNNNINNSNSNNNNNNNNNNNITTAPVNKIPASALKVKQAKVKNLKVKSKAKKTIKVNWKKVSGAKGYKIEVSKNNKFKKKAIVIKKTTKKLKLKIKNKKLKSKKTYYVRVRAYTTYKVNGATKKVYSSLKAIKKVKVK